MKAGIIGQVRDLRSFWDADHGFNYQPAGTFYTELAGEDAAEWAFNLLNSPTRNYEGELLQGRSESLSVGGVVKVEGRDKQSKVIAKYFMCSREGWLEL